jgi:hypothetical protein
MFSALELDFLWLDSPANAVWGLCSPRETFLSESSIFLDIAYN